MAKKNEPLQYDNLHSGVLFKYTQVKDTDPFATGSYHWESHHAPDARLEAYMRKDGVRGLQFVVRHQGKIIGRGDYEILTEPRGNLIAMGVIRNAKGKKLYGIKVFATQLPDGRKFHQIRRIDGNAGSLEL